LIEVPRSTVVCAKASEVHTIVRLIARNVLDLSNILYYQCLESGVIGKVQKRSGKERDLKSVS